VNLAAGEMHDLKTICTTIPGPIRRAPKIGVSDLGEIHPIRRDHIRKLTVLRSPKNALATLKCLEVAQKFSSRIAD
jgi:hypothetical protein